jgi:hypothetical protein
MEREGGGVYHYRTAYEFSFKEALLEEEEDAATGCCLPGVES